MNDRSIAEQPITCNVSIKKTHFEIAKKQEEITVFLNDANSITVMVGERANEIPLEHAFAIGKALAQLAKQEGM